MAENRQEEEYLDNETGEKNLKVVCISSMPRNAETGEPETEERILQRKSQISRSHLQQHQEKMTRKLEKTRKKLHHGFYCRKQEIRSNIVKEFVLCKRRRVSPIVLMLPTFFICPGWASILCLLGEACMHFWSHKRNWKKKNSNVEYRSPFHLISSLFCVHCRSQKYMEKISQIQDKRNFRRRILYPNFGRREPH